MLHVVHVELGVFIDLTRAVPTNLPPACQSRAYGETSLVMLGVPVDQVRLFRTWSNPAHVATDDVPELWKLVQGCPAQQPSHASHTRVVVSHLEAIRWRIHMHASELVDRKRLAMLADPTLPKNH